MAESLPAFLRFEPVPVRARHDGWSPELQRRFILALARGAGPDEAARRLGRSRQTAYALRRRPGAASFAAAWDAAVAFAQRVGAPTRRFGDVFGPDAIFVPRFYRGRLVGFVRREDDAALMRTLAALDRVAARMESTGSRGGSQTASEPLSALEADKADGIRA